MNTEKIEKLKKSLSNSKIPADLKPKIEAEIKRLEDLDAKQSEPKEEVKPVAKKTTTRKPRATKTVAKKTSTRKPSQTSKPKRTPMSLAKEIRKEGESWSEARARASKMMKEKTHTATKDVESELDKLTKLVRGKKELKGQIGRTNLLIDAKRKAKPMGRRISKDGNVYYENRANRTDKGTFGKYHLAEGGGVGRGIVLDKFKGQRPNNRHYSLEMFTNPDGLDYFRLYDDTSNEILAQSYDLEEVKLYAEMFKGKRYAEGGDLMKGLPENFEVEIGESEYTSEKGNGVNFYGMILYKGYTFKFFSPYDSKKDVKDSIKRYLKSLSVSNITLDNSPEKGDFSVYYKDRNGVHLHTEDSKEDLQEFIKDINKLKKSYAEGGYLTDPTFGNFQNQVFADGGFMDGVYAKGGITTNKGILETFLNSNKNLKVGNLSTHFAERENFVLLRNYGTLIAKRQGNVVTINTKKYSKTTTTITNMLESLAKEQDMEILKVSSESEFADGGFMDNVYAKGGGVRTINGREYSYGRNWTNDHNLTNKGEEHEVNYTRKKRFELGGTVVTDLAGHTGGGTGGLNAGMPLDGFSNTSYTGLVGETGAMSSGEMFMAGGSIDKNFDLSGYKKFRTFNDLEEAKEYVDMDRKKYPRVKESVVIKEGNRFQVWVVPATGIETGNRVYELGGGLPSGASQSYMITESLGNPAQHFAKGGGVGKMYYHILEYGDYGNIGYQGYYDTLEEAQKQVKKLSDYFPNQTFEIFADKSRKEPPITTMAKGGGIRKVGGREYPLGRNWTNDHEHTNKGEEHEVNYTRKGKFLGIFKEGGEIKNQYAGRTPEDIWNSLSVEQRKHFLLDHILGEEEIEQITYRYAGEDNREFVDEYSNKEWKKLSGDVKQAFREHVKIGQYAKGGGVRRVGNREYSLGRNWTNDHEHVNKAEEHETKYTRKKSFAGGGAIGETPKIYVADLEAYNNGRLSGVWLDLADYNDADELMEAIQDFLNTTGGEEYAIHDAEYIPSSMYSEYMGQKDFEELYEMIDLAKENDLPLSVVQEVVSQYDASAVEEFQGKYDDAEDFAQQLVDDIGIESFIGFQYYLYISDTDRRLLAQDMADSYVDDIRDEDGGNRLIEEAGLDVDEYEEADSDRQEEMLDEAREIVYDEYYDNWYEGLFDPYYFLVENQGLYSADDFAKANFVQIDYERLGEDLEQDYTFIYDDGELYVFNIR